MARPVKWRKIENLPAVSHFGPQGAADGGPENTLKLEELEAVRLKDLEGLEQRVCAQRMEISRPTFQRILLSARAKIADSLVNGKALQIAGGHFATSVRPLCCKACGRAWTGSPGAPDADVCPGCGSRDIACGGSCGAAPGHGRGHRHGQHGR